MDNQKFIFDLKQIAHEIYAYMRQFILPIDYLCDRAYFCKQLEHLLYVHTKNVIECNLNKVIRDTNIGLDNNDPYIFFAKEFNLDQLTLENTIASLMSLRYITDTIDKAMGPDTFDVWTVCPFNGIYIFENMGDFRIQQWTMEHIRDGKYKP